MATTVISPFIKRIDLIKERLPTYASRIVIEHAEIIIEILKSNQLAYGKDSEDKVVGYYSSYTSKMAYEDRQQYGYPKSSKTKGDPYDFQWTMELFNSLTLKGDTAKREYNIFSFKGKLEKLEAIYNRNLGDLTEKNNDWVNQNVILPELYKIILSEMVIGLI